MTPPSLKTQPPSGPFSLGRPPSLPGPHSHDPPISSLPPPTLLFLQRPLHTNVQRSCFLHGFVAHILIKRMRQLTKYSLDVMYLVSDKMKSKCVERKRKTERGILSGG